MYKGKKLSKGLTYLSLVTLISPMLLQGQQVLAEEVEGTEVKTEESTKVSEDNSQEDLTADLTLEDKTIDLPNESGEVESVPIVSASELNGMYTIGKTADGRIIQSSAVSTSNPLLRGVGNVQGEVIRITIAGVLYEGVKITIDGKGALCIDQHLRAPFEPNVPYDNGVPYQNDGVLAILSHGAYGPNNPSPTDEQILLTEIALRNWLTGKLTPSEAVSNSHPYIADLIAKAQAGDFITQSFDFDKQTSESVIQGDKQVSETFSTKGDSTNYVKIPVPNGVTLTNLNTGEKITNGVATIYGGQKFNFSAPLDYAKKYNSGDLKAAFGKPVALMFTPFDAGYQRLMQGNFDDPQTVLPISVNFFARLGKLQIGKQDAVTGNMVPNTTYEGTIGDEAVSFTTDESGWSPLSKEYIHDTPYNLVETAVPAGYVLNQTPMTGRIVGGEDTKIIQKNDIQNAELTIEKEIEVFKPEETTQQGKPVYEMVPAEAIPFTLKNETDTTAPDGKTVIQAAGDYSDTQVTDAEGKATFKPFYNGAQNPYTLTEDETPKNYRPMETKTIVKEYGDSTISAVAYTEKITNLRQKGNLKLNKKNSIDLSNPLNLEGAKFSLKGVPNTAVSDVFFTFDSTKETNDVNDLPAGTYELVEFKTPNGFQIPTGQTNIQYVTIEDNQTTTVDWENQPITPETPVTPKTTTPVTPVATSTPTKATLPHTGEETMTWVSILGAMTIVAGTAGYVFYKRKIDAAQK